jgi:hypothetical protein
MAIRYVIEDVSCFDIEKSPIVLKSLTMNLKVIAILVEEFTSHSTPEGLIIETSGNQSEQYLSSHAFHPMKECMVMIVSLVRAFFAAEKVFEFKFQLYR